MIVRRSRCIECGKWSHADGITAALRSSAKFGVPYRPYRCPVGNGYHLSTKPDRNNPEKVSNP